MKEIELDGIRKHKGHYSAGIISNHMLYISGQLSIDPITGSVPDGGIEEHMRTALFNLENVLAQAHVRREDVVQCRLYISDIDCWEQVNALYEKFFRHHKPARIIVPVGKLHYGCLVEIEAIAEVKAK